MTDLGTNLQNDTAIPKAVRKPRAAISAEGGAKTVRIVLEEADHIPPTGLFVGHNGRGYLLRAGEEMDVPEAVLNVLNDAVMSTPIQDTSSGQVLGYRDRRRYNYRLV